MLFLTKIVARTGNPFVQRDLANCREMHRTIMSAFEPSADRGMRERLGILYRIEPKASQTVILLQSTVLPDLENIRGKFPGYVEGHSTKDLSPLIARLEDGTRFRFLLLANPAVHLDGKLLPIKSPADAEKWMHDRADRGGFNIVAMRSTKDLDWRPHGGDIVLNVVLFEGILSITNKTKFFWTLQTGIGHGKPFGLGLLSVGLTHT